MTVLRLPRQQSPDQLIRENLLPARAGNGCKVRFPSRGREQRLLKGDPRSEARRKGEGALSENSHPTKSDLESFPGTGEGDLYGFRDPAKFPSPRPGDRQVADPRVRVPEPPLARRDGHSNQAEAGTSTHKVTRKKLANDPTAGSPTVTLLRLLLPLNAQVWESSRATLEA